MSGIAFYEAAAQIIPVLMIVIALETRAFQTFAGASRRGRLLDVLAIAVIFAGEARALRAIQVGHAGRFLGFSDSTWVWYALGLEAFVVALAALFGRQKTR